MTYTAFITLGRHSPQDVWSVGRRGRTSTGFITADLLTLAENLSAFVHRPPRAAANLCVWAANLWAFGKNLWVFFGGLQVFAENLSACAENLRGFMENLQVGDKNLWVIVRNMQGCAENMQVFHDCSHVVSVRFKDTFQNRHKPHL